LEIKKAPFTINCKWGELRAGSRVFYPGYMADPFGTALEARRDGRGRSRGSAVGVRIESSAMPLAREPLYPFLDYVILLAPES